MTGYQWRGIQGWDPAQAKAQPGRPPVACGTPAGYEKHRRNGETICDPCRDARNEYRRDQRAQGVNA